VIDQIVSNFSITAHLVTAVFIAGEAYAGPTATKCVENHSWQKVFDVFALIKTVPYRRRYHQGAVMKARFTRSWAIASRANLALALTLFTTASALAAQVTPEQKKACTPDVYRLCAGEIPNVRAITSCLRRQKASLSEACRAVFEQ
jgi:hypothetical protein